MIFKNPEPKNLEEWLETATKGIAAPGRERIAREIGAHYADAVEAHVSQGESEEVAQNKALAELGDANTARRRFRRGHLTERDEKWVLKVQNWANSKVCLALKAVGCLLMIHLVKEIHPNCTLLFSVLMSGCMACAIFAFWKFRRLAIRPKLSSLLLIESIQAMLMAFAFASLACTGYASFFGWALVLYMIAYPIRLIQMRKKIRKNENPALGKPEGGTPSAA